MSGWRAVRIVVSAVLIQLTLGSMAPLEGQLGRLRRAAGRAAENALEREVERQVDRAVTGMVRCAIGDSACIEEAKENGDAVEITDEDGNVLRDANGNPISDPEYAEASRSRPGKGAWRNYDFVPGDRIIFHEDYTNDNLGDFPQRIEFMAGNMEIVDSDGLRILRVTGGSQRDAQFAIPLGEELPEQFTLEFPVHWSYHNLTVRVYFEADGQYKPPAGGTYQLQHLVVDNRQTGIYDWQGDGPVATEPLPQVLEGWVTVRLMADGRHVKAYVNEKRVANIPQADLGRDSKIWFTLRDGRDEWPIYVGPITVAAGGRDLYDRLEAEGTVATRGILFALDSDALLPESTPVLEEIGQMMSDHPDLRLGITGHTDSQGADDYNLDLSNRRAASVVRYLVEEHDIDAGRFESEGKGETEPVDTNDTAEGRANNRRVELHDLRPGAATPAQPGASAPAQPNTPAQPGARAQSSLTPTPSTTNAANTSPGRDAAAAPGNARAVPAVSRPTATQNQPRAGQRRGEFRPEMKGGSGEITITLGGATETLPIWGGMWDTRFLSEGEPGTSDYFPSGLVAFRLIASPADDPDRSAGDAVSHMRVGFNKETLEIHRGYNNVYDHRAKPVTIENYLAAMDVAANSDLRFTISAYEERGLKAFVSGSFTGTAEGGRSLSGQFSAEVHAAACRLQGSPGSRLEGRMTEGGCVAP